MSAPSNPEPKKRVRPERPRAEIETPFLREDDAAAYLCLGTGTLQNWRLANRMPNGRPGPKYRKHGSRVLYRIADLDAWSDEQSRYCSTDAPRPIADGRTGESAGQ